MFIQSQDTVKVSFAVWAHSKADNICVGWGALEVSCTVKVTHKTGVEMEALTGASIAALTIYDMCKALSQEMVVHDLHLVSKTGGKSDVGRFFE